MDDPVARAVVRYVLLRQIAGRPEHGEVMEAVAHGLADDVLFLLRELALPLELGRRGRFLPRLIVPPLDHRKLSFGTASLTDECEHTP